MADFILRWRDRNGKTVEWGSNMCDMCMPFQLTTGTCINGGPFPVFTYHIENLQSFSVDLDTPVCVIRLPEQGSDRTFVIKTQGNAVTMNLSWTLASIDTNTMCTVVDELDGFCCRPGPVQTVCEQLDFVINTMENTGLDFEWDLYVGEDDFNGGDGGTVTPGCGRTPITVGQSVDAFNESSTFRKQLKITKLIVSKSGSTPVTYLANMTMIVGERLLSIDETCEVAEPTQPTS